MKNKKGSLVGMIGFIVALFMWILMWVAVIDPADYILDDVADDIWDSMVDNTSTWYSTHSTLRTRTTNFKQYAFWGGLVGIFISMMAYAWYSRANQYVR